MAVIEATYKVVGMTCQSCAASVQTLLEHVPGVERAQVHFANQEVVVVHEPDRASFEVLRAALAPAGYELLPDTQAQLKAQRVFLRRLLRDVGIAGVLAIGGMLLAWGPFHAPGWALGYYLLTGPMVVWIGAHFWRPAWQQLKVRKLTMDSLVTLGLLGSLALGTAEVLRGQPGHAAGAAAEILFFVLIGRYLEERARLRGQAVLESLSALATPTARRRTPTGSNEVIPTTQVAVGDLVEVAAGETLPIDGYIVGGQSFVEESLLTGEPLPVEKGPGQRVWAGTRNLSASLLVRAEVQAGETLLAQLIGRLQRAQSTAARAQRLADTVSAYFVPGVLVLAGLAFFLHWIRGAEVFFAWERALSVLVISCPCALGLATPLAVQMAISGAARAHMLLREAAQLENLPLATTWAFDKTGTLTHGRATVQEATWYAPSYAGVLRFLCSRSLHPLAQALAAYLAEQSTPTEAVELQAYVELPGKGIVATLPSGKIYIGSPAWIAEKFPSLAPPKATAVAAASEQELIGLFTFSDTVREGLRPFVQCLRAEGKQLILLTGDPSGAGRQLAEHLGFDSYKEGLTPFEKARWIEELQKSGQRVVFVGDGINDALALQTAYVGIAVHRSAGAAVQSAGIALLREVEEALPALYDLSRRLRRIIAQNLAWAFGYNLLAIPVAMGLVPGVYLSPGLSALLMSLSSLSVVLNSLRLRLPAG